MQKHSSKLEFMTLLTFLIVVGLLLTNGFAARINAEENTADVYREIEPVGKVLATILDEYVRDADMEKVVEGALMGMMGSLDRNSSFISQDDLKRMREDTQGQFEGIGVHILANEELGYIEVKSPLIGSPAAEAGLLPMDLIIAIDDVSALGFTTAEAADKIKGPRGTTVKLTILRRGVEGGEDETLDINVKRARVELESVKEVGMLDDGIVYMRVSDFKDNTARDLRDKLKKKLDEGMKAFVLDLRWNPGGLLTASKETCELFLPKGSLVTYTKGRVRADGSPNSDDMELYTEMSPVLPQDMPIVVLVNGQTASSSEIVTGALQFYKRALIVGEKTFGKGSVQTIIPLELPEMSALRLTTALYYTPADVTIDHQGILPDVESVMETEAVRELARQMSESYDLHPLETVILNHGSLTDYDVTEATVEDTPLVRAVEIIKSAKVWSDTMEEFHRDVRETQMNEAQAQAEAESNGGATDAEAEVETDESVFEIDETVE